MRALAKLVSTNTPDKIIFVGEALVGNEAVDQLTKFDRALRDFSSASGYGGGGTKERGIDGMIVTKWDTVDDKVRTTHPLRPSMTILMRRTGRCGIVNDVCHWPAHYLCWMRTGVQLINLVDTNSYLLMIQTYTDLRQLRVSNVVQAILDD